MLVTNFFLSFWHLFSTWLPHKKHLRKVWTRLPAPLTRSQPVGGTQRLKISWVILTSLRLMATPSSTASWCAALQNYVSRIPLESLLRMLTSRLNSWSFTWWYPLSLDGRPYVRVCIQSLSRQHCFSFRFKSSIMILVLFKTMKTSVLAGPGTSGHCGRSPVPSKGKARQQLQEVETQLEVGCPRFN